MVFVIDVEEINDVAVSDPVVYIAQRPGEDACQGEFSREGKRTDQDTVSEDNDNDHGHKQKNDVRQPVLGKEAESSPVVPHVDDGEKRRDINAREIGQVLHNKDLGPPVKDEDRGDYEEVSVSLHRLHTPGLASAVSISVAYRQQR